MTCRHGPVRLPAWLRVARAGDLAGLRRAAQRDRDCRGPRPPDSAAIRQLGRQLYGPDTAADLDAAAGMRCYRRHTRPVPR